MWEDMIWDPKLCVWDLQGPWECFGLKGFEVGNFQHSKKNIFKKNNLLDPRGSEMFFSLCSVGWSLRTWRKIWSKTPSLCVWDLQGPWECFGLKWFEVGSYTQKRILKKNSLLDPRGSEMFFLYVVLADLGAHVGRYDLRPQAMCIRPARAMWVLWFERVWSWELPTRKKICF